MNFGGNGGQILSNTSPPLEAKYHGLLNQGATCYLNSVLQVLFMTKDFREAVERHTSKNPGTEYIDRDLTNLFDHLKRQTACTYKITKKLGIDRVDEQRDSAEYFEKILSLTSTEASQIFRGWLTNKNICSQCLTENDNDEACWHLPLSLVDSCDKDYSVVNGIEAFFRPTVFIGENQMYCDVCDAKTDATNKCVIKDHPEVLMLLLKRFEFDYRYMTYVKINCTVDVPYTLQIPETYKLYAVVNHFGDLRSGHYQTVIKDDESWYCFNDDRVTLLDDQPFQVDNLEKSQTAYLLFYRKANVHAPDCTQDIGEESSPGGFPPATSDIYVQHVDVGKSREREEVEGAAEVHNHTVEAVSIGKNEEEETQHEESVEDQDSEMASGRGKLHPCYNEIEDSGRVGDSEQNKPKDDEGCEKENKRSEHVNNRADSLRQEGLPERLTENQGFSSVEEMRHGDTQPKARTAFHERTTEGRHGSENLRIYYGKIIEEVINGGIQIIGVTYIRIKTVERTSEDGIKSFVEYSDDPFKTE